MFLSFALSKSKPPPKRSLPRLLSTLLLFLFFYLFLLFLLYLYTPPIFLFLFSSFALNGFFIVFMYLNIYIARHPTRPDLARGQKEGVIKRGAKAPKRQASEKGRPFKVSPLSLNINNKIVFIGVCVIY